MNVFQKLESLGFFDWLEKEASGRYSAEIPEYYDKLAINDIERNGVNALAFRWLRTKNIFVSIDTYHSVSPNKPFALSIDYLHESGKWDYIDSRGDTDFETHEEAEYEALKVVIAMLENIK